MKKIFYFSILLLFSCNSKDEDIVPTDLANGPITKTKFAIDSVFARKIDNEYLIIFKNDFETLLIGTNDTIEGNYKLLNAPIRLENDSIYFDEDIKIENRSAIAALLKNETSYLSTAGSVLNIRKDENYNISGNFNATFSNIKKSPDSLTLETISFENIKPIVYVDPNITPPILDFQITKEDFQDLLNTSQNKLVDSKVKEILLDGFYTNQIVSQSPNDLNNKTITPSSIKVSNFWKDLYTTIYRANIVLENVEKASKSNIDGLNTIQARALVVRAYAYETLINWFGEVPLILSTPANISETAVTSKSISQIEAQIIKDLEFALNYLPNRTAANTSEENKDFAKVVLAKIYFRQKKHTEVIQTLNTITIPNLNGAIYRFDIDIDQQDFSFKEYIKQDEIIVSNYTEVLLLLAEANNQTNNIQAAVNYLNQLKTDNIPSVETTSKTEVSNLIYKQWIDVLPLNGNRFYVLKAFQKAISTLNIEPYQLVLPIPETELDSNPNIQQNPGY